MRDSIRGKEAQLAAPGYKKFRTNPDELEAHLREIFLASEVFTNHYLNYTYFKCNYMHKDVWTLSKLTEAQLNQAASQRPLSVVWLAEEMPDLFRPRFVNLLRKNYHESPWARKDILELDQQDIASITKDTHPSDRGKNVSKAIGAVSLLTVFTYRFIFKRTERFSVLTKGSIPTSEAATPAINPVALTLMDFATAASKLVTNEKLLAEVERLVVRPEFKSALLQLVAAAEYSKK